MFMTFDEIVEDMLLFQMTEVLKRSLRVLKEKDLVSLHHTVGQAIMNHYNMWNPNNPLTLLKYEPMMSESGVDYNPKHPDSVSMDVITVVWKRLQ